MPIFRYTVKKIFVSPSTWVILGLSILCLGLSWSLPFAIARAQFPIEIPWTKDLVLSMFLNMWKIFTFSTFISFTLIIFIGVKATQIFRDEIDDGTLLILVSKPISRNKIWAEKWLSFQVTLILYVFVTILVSGLLLLIPKIGNATIYSTLLPYMGILFGIALLFDLIISSIVLLLSLVLNSKATIAISIGFAALINIFSQALELLVIIPSEYFDASHAVAVYHDIGNKLGANDLAWIKTELTKDETTYKKEIDDILKRVYTDFIPSVPSYPDAYDPIKEQEFLNDIKNNPSNYPTYTTNEIDLISHIVNVSNVFRQWKEQSYRELMTSQKAGGEGWIIFPGAVNSSGPGSNSVNYSFFNLYQGLTQKFSQPSLDLINTQIFQKKMLRYFNIFYHFYYLWTGSWGDNSSLYVSNNDYKDQNDPYLISFTEIDSVPIRQYQVDTESGNNKILNFPVLLAVYLVIGMTLLGTSWYVFNTRDFT